MLVFLLEVSTYSMNLSTARAITPASAKKLKTFQIPIEFSRDATRFSKEAGLATDLLLLEDLLLPPSKGITDSA